MKLWCPILCTGSKKHPWAHFQFKFLWGSNKSVQNRTRRRMLCVQSHTFTQTVRGDKCVHADQEDRHRALPQCESEHTERFTLQRVMGLNPTNGLFPACHSPFPTLSIILSTIKLKEYKPQNESKHCCWHFLFTDNSKEEVMRETKQTEINEDTNINKTSLITVSTWG